jgi:hypothetical protein
MTTKEKALELWEKYFRLNYDWDGGTKDEWAKEGALIAVDEILKCVNNPDEYYLMDYSIIYWQEVKKEIEAL